MKNILSIMIQAALLGTLLYGCSGTKDRQEITVRGGEPVTYVSDSGDRIVARYYSLSDKSLEFVKVTLPGGREFTLPRVLSASGVRYTDDMEIVWWTKGNTAFAEARDENGQWQIKYNCTESPVVKK